LNRTYIKKPSIRKKRKKTEHNIKTMKKSILILFLAVFVGSTVKAQETTHKCSVRISDVYVSGGGSNLMNFSSFGLDEFSRLAPVTLQDYYKFNGYDFSSGENMNSSGIVSVKLGLNFGSQDGTKRKFLPQLRLGLSYSGSTLFDGYMSYEKRTPYDTLISVHNGDQYFIDSVTRYDLNMSYKYEQLRLDAACIFRTPETHKFTLYGGIGINGGVLMNPRTTISHSRSSYIDNMFNYDFSDSKYENLMDETTGNKWGYVFAAYVPLGMDLQLGRKNEFMKHIHLFYEMNFGLNFTHIPELKTYTNMSMSHAFGIRVSTWK
jgi:hypothetical protein